MKPLTPPLIYGLIAGLFCVTAPHVWHLPAWISIFSAAILAWRLYLAYSCKPLPARWLLFCITAACTAGIQYSYHTLFGRDAGVALLISLVTLKLLELRSARDATLLLYLSCFIIITNFFYSQSIPVALMMLASLLLILATLLHLHSGAAAFRTSLKTAALLLLQAIPLTLLLFVLFPRVQGPLWGMPQTAYSRSGLSNSMAPGTLSKLALSPEIAFRVSFTGFQPRRQEMYWRGPVLSNFDGTRWSAAITSHRKQPLLGDLSRPVDYTVTLEPHNQNWLFALEMPTNISIPYEMSDNFQIQRKETVNTRLRYTAHSRLGYRVNVEESSAQLENSLQLPAGLNPRARKLASEWRRRLHTDDAVIEASLALFNRANYIYTLEPPLLGENGIDDFLFESQQGFCEHYASSFVFLMRAAGIPARVVTGYQGGEYNALGGYTIVRQADAHAWAEVWLKNKGWQRIDPTAAISPERVQLGLHAALPDGISLPFLTFDQASWLHTLRLDLDILNYQWNQWVLGYNDELQFAFLTRLGMEEVSWQKMAINLLSGIALLLGVVSLQLLRKLHCKKTDAAQSIYLKFCNKLSRAGVFRHPGEGPLDYAVRATRQKPHLATAINDITKRYVRLRYTAHNDKNDLSALSRAVSAFKL